jgi:hypothetical protein
VAFKGGEVEGRREGKEGPGHRHKSITCTVIQYACRWTHVRQITHEVAVYVMLPSPVVVVVVFAVFSSFFNFNFVSF